MKKISMGISVIAVMVLSMSMIPNFELSDLSNNKEVSLLDSNRKTVVRKLSSFENISASNAVSIKIVEGKNSGEITITADEDVIDDIKTVVKNNTLDIEIKSDKKFRWKNRGKIEITIPLKKLRNLKLSGASNLVANKAISVEDFKMDISGASKATLNLIANNINVDLSGASKVELTGNSQNLYLDLSGASKFSGESMKASLVKFELSGASSSKVWAVNNLKGSASGASSLSYKDVSGLNKDTNTSGASSVKSY